MPSSAHVVTVIICAFNCKGSLRYTDKLDALDRAHGEILGRCPGSLTPRLGGELCDCQSIGIVVAKCSDVSEQNQNPCSHSSVPFTSVKPVIIAIDPVVFDIVDTHHQLVHDLLRCLTQ